MDVKSFSVVVQMFFRSVPKFQEESLMQRSAIRRWCFKGKDTQGGHLCQRTAHTALREGSAEKKPAIIGRGKKNHANVYEKFKHS